LWVSACWRAKAPAEGLAKEARHSRRAPSLGRKRRTRRRSQPTAIRLLDVCLNSHSEERPDRTGLVTLHVQCSAFAVIAFKRSRYWNISSSAASRSGLGGRRSARSINSRSCSANSRNCWASLGFTSLPSARARPSPLSLGAPKVLPMRLPTTPVAWMDRHCDWSIRPSVRAS